MNRRFVFLGLALVVVLTASLSGVYARQVWSESQAHARLVSAQAASDRALSRAASDGLLPAELAPFRARAARLAAERPPAGASFWNPAVGNFYTRQAAAFSALRGSIYAAVQRITLLTRREAGRTLRTLSQEIMAARALDLHPTAASSALRQGRAAFTSARLPRDYRSIMRSAGRSLLHLQRSVAARRGFVQRVLAAAHDQQSAVVQRAAGEVAQLKNKLYLLGLLTPRARQYSASLSGLLQTVRSQTSAYQAAVKSYAVDAEAALVLADYRKTVPSKMIVVSTEQQWAWWYQDGSQVNDSPVTTGGPELPTDHGVFHIYMKASPWVFHSPWPPGSPFYYNPTPIQYWMPFDGAEGLHDAWWRSNFGPGSNLAPTDLGTGNYILGTHGCVNLPLDKAAFTWNWAPIGTTVVVI